MKIVTKFTHYWFVIVSVLSFLAGWGMLAHSLKPVTSTQTTTTTTNNIVALPTLQPIQVFGSSSGTNNGLNLTIAQTNNQASSGFPVLRTGGS